LTARPFTTLDQRGAGALFAGMGSFTFSHRERIVALAARHRVRAIYQVREFVAAGGLMSYSPSIPAAYRQVGRLPSAAAFRCKHLKQKVRHDII